MPISLRAVACLSAEVRCAPQAAHLAPACADADGLEIPSSACNRAFRGFAWRYSDRYHEDLSSCVLYFQLRSCSRFEFSVRICLRTVSGSSAARAVAVIASSAGSARSKGHLFMRVASVRDADSAAHGMGWMGTVGLSLTRRCENPLLTIARP